MDGGAGDPYAELEETWGRPQANPGEAAMQTSTIFRIVPSANGRWTILGSHGAALPGHPDYPGPNEAVAALQDLARSHGMEMSVRYRPDGSVERVVIGKGLADRQPLTLTFTLPPDSIDAVDEVGGALRLDRDEVVRRAIALLKVAFDASEVGNHLAIITPDDEVVREIIGVRPEEPAAPTAAR
jgi:hypothetical protein